MVRGKSAYCLSPKHSSSASNISSNFTGSLGNLSIITQNPKDNTPYEQNPSHRAFLARSLSRNDKELVALQLTNKTLHKLKEIILSQFGESILLDIGEGIIHLAPHDSSLVIVGAKNKWLKESIVEPLTSLIRDFLLRMRLRTKLLNRLSRRLMRLSNAMDGNVLAIQPPQLPRYGEERFENISSDDECVKEAKIWTNRKNLIINNITKQECRKIEVEGKLKDENKYNNLLEANGCPENEELTVMEEQKIKIKTEQESYIPFLYPKKYKDDGDLSTFIEYDEDYTKYLITTSPRTAGAKFSKVENFNKEYTNPLLCSERKFASFKYKLLNTPSTHIDLQLIEKTEAYFDKCGQSIGNGIGATVKNMSLSEKIQEWKRWQADILSSMPYQPTFQDLNRKYFVYSLKERRVRCNRLKKEHLRDEYSSVKNTPLCNINSMPISFKPIKESERLEDKRVNHRREEVLNDVNQYKATISNKGEMSLGYENCRESFPMEYNIVYSQHNCMPDNKDNVNDISFEKCRIKNVNIIQKLDNELESTISNKKHINLSLKPLPSFYEQDYRRILLIHNDAQILSIHQYNKMKISQETVEYNRVYKSSLEIQREKLTLEQKLNSLIYHHRVKTNKLRNDYALQVEIAKAKWQREKKDFENNMKLKIEIDIGKYGKTRHSAIMEAMNMSDIDVIKRTLTSIIDRVVITNSPNNFSTCSFLLATVFKQSSFPKSKIAAMLCHLLDIVTKRVEKGWISDCHLKSAEALKYQIPFIAPQPNIENLTFNEVQKNKEKNLKRELKIVTSKLVASEKDRASAWTKLTRTKQECDSMSATKYGIKRGQIDLTKLSIPPLKGIPNVIALKNYISLNLPSYVPPSKADMAKAVLNSLPPPPIEPPLHQPTIPGSHPSKYTAEKVRARIYSDGSVLPVSAPKKDKSGMYLRPAGRQRKGMDWDAIKGIWVPSTDRANFKIVRE